MARRSLPGWFASAIGERHIIVVYFVNFLWSQPFRCHTLVKLSNNNRLSYRTLTPLCFANSKIIPRFSAFSPVVQSKNTCRETIEWKKIGDRYVSIRASELHYNVDACADKSCFGKRNKQAPTTRWIRTWSAFLSSNYLIDMKMWKIRPFSNVFKCSLVFFRRNPISVCWFIISTNKLLLRLYSIKN